MALGAGVGGLAYLSSQVAQYYQDQAKRRKAENGSSDVLTVTIPSKTAGVGASLGAIARQGANTWKSGLGGKLKVLAATLTPAVLGAGAEAGTSKLLDQESPIVTALSNAKNSAGGAWNSATTAINNHKIQPPGPEKVPKSLGWDSAMWMGGSLLGGSLGFNAINDFSRSRRKTEEQAKLDRAKQEYADLLGKSLAGPKLATVLEFPTIESFVEGLAVGLCPDPMEKKSSLDILGVPGILGTLSAIVAHNYVYNRATASDKALQTNKVKPPKSIRLVSAAPKTSPVTPPAPEPGDAAQAMDDETDKIAMALQYLIKSAGLTDSLQDGALSAILGEPKVEPIPDPSSFEPKVEQIDANTVVIHTADGPVKVDASDPQAQALLHKKKKVLAQAMAGVSALPV